MRKQETWVDNRWRPTMAWAYIAICAFDFVIAPIFNAWFSYSYGIDFLPWVPLTTTSGGIFHVSMGAILGATAYSRGQEKIKRLERPAIEEDHDVID